MLWEEKITDFFDEFNVTDVNREIILERVLKFNLISQLG